MSLDYLGDISTQTYIQFASIAFLCYDHILTFPAEVSHIWPQPFSRHTFLFFLNRYAGLFANTGSSLLVISMATTEKNCTSLGHVREILLVLSQFIVSAILLSRVFALYHISRSTRTWAFSLGAVLAVVSSWALIGEKGTFIGGVPGCHFLVPERTAVHLATAWEAQALFDTVVFTLTVMKTVEVRKTLNTATGAKGTGLLDILLRDGALYFAIMALAVLTNVLALYFLRPTLKIVFTLPTNCISVTMCSRLVLNLYEAATPGDTISSSSPDPATTCVLTTRIELGISTDDRSDEELEGIPS